MFERIGRLAEAAASNVGVSRRGFLGRLGQGALVAVGVLGGVLVSPKSALASSVFCCSYHCVGFKGGHLRRCYTYGCPGTTGTSYRPCYLMSQKTVSDCKHC
jgi:hypothetical protein